MWLAEESIRLDRPKDRPNVSFEFWVPGEAFFGIPKYAQLLADQGKERAVTPHFKQLLTGVDSKTKTATFKNLSDGSTAQVKFDLLHVAPPMSPPSVIKTSSLANEAGYVAVDNSTLQSTKYPNVFAIGDCTSTPNSKTAAAITAQAPVLVHNLHRVMSGTQPNGVYNGYASCPLIIGKGQVILAEFGYGGKIMETFNPETGRWPLTLLGQDGPLQRKIFYVLKERLFPFAYWHLWPKGLWYGTTGPIRTTVQIKSE